MLAVEILSPTQRALELYEKVQQIYLPVGIKSVWIVQPLAHTIAVMNHDAVTLRHECILDDQTGIAIDLRIIFED